MIARVYSAINAVSAAFATDGIAKERLNARDGYLYRSIDDVLVRISPLLAEHRLCILPRVLERAAVDRLGDGGELLVSVSVRVAFDLVSAEDGSSHTIEAAGEALDAGDKGTAKAMQSAYKYALLQAFCVPVPQAEDADTRSYRIQPVPVPREPEEGWSRWVRGVEEVVSTCTNLEDLDRVQDDARSFLAGLSREQPQLYKHVGQAITAKRSALGSPGGSSSPVPRTNKGPSSGAKARTLSKPKKRSRAGGANGSTVHA